MRLTHILPVLLTCASLSAQWTQLSPVFSPSARRAGAMAFDANSNQMLMYGGTSASPSLVLSEMWNLNGQVWVQNNSPSPGRWGHQMVSNPVNNRILTFGGRSPTISGLANDTVEWNGTAWATIPTSDAPSPRFLYGMCFDSTRNVYVLFGGRDVNGTNDETWEFNGITWNQVMTATTPPAREEMLMVYDTTLNRTVMFGGCNDDTDTILGDTWTYDGTDWTLELDSNCPGCPTPRVRMASAFDTSRLRTIMFGGYEELPDGTRLLSNATWEFSGSEWIDVAPPTSPSNVTETYYAFDQANNRFVVFGGFGGTFSNDTWAYTGTAGGLFSLYGQACDIGLGAPTLTGTVPTIGQPVDLTFGNLTPNTDIVLVALGLSNLDWMGIPLPFDLGLIGLPGCGLVTAADVIELALAGNGDAVFSLPIPNDTNLVNRSFYCQGVLLDLDLFVFEGATRGGRALIGQ